jgi:hypothetical protein
LVQKIRSHETGFDVFVGLEEPEAGGTGKSGGGGLKHFGGNIHTNSRDDDAFSERFVKENAVSASVVQGAGMAPGGMRWRTRLKRARWEKRGRALPPLSRRSE